MGFADINKNRHVIAACMLFGMMAGTRASAQAIQVGDPQPAAAVSMADIDHSTWDALLQKYVNQRGMVKYAALKSNAADMQVLDSYLKHLSSARVEPATAANRNDQLAFWINSYKAIHVSSPFGGSLNSGFGRSSGTDALMEYTSAKSVWLDSAPTPRIAFGYVS